MECDITTDGALVIKCASEAEMEGMRAWWRKALLDVQEVYVPGPDGQTYKVARVMDADRITLRR